MVRFAPDSDHSQYYVSYDNYGRENGGGGGNELSAAARANPTGPPPIHTIPAFSTSFSLLAAVELRRIEMITVRDRVDSRKVLVLLERSILSARLRCGRKGRIELDFRICQIRFISDY